ncbi:cupin-like domain-containing protein [bacterium]|nr:cupin-like domain-containing protein [bacterium]
MTPHDPQPVFELLLRHHANQPRLKNTQPKNRFFTLDEYEREIFPAGYPALFPFLPEEYDFESLVDRLTAGVSQTEARATHFKSGEAYLLRNRDRKPLKDLVAAAKAKPGEKLYLGNFPVENSVAEKLLGKAVAETLHGLPLDPPSGWISFLPTATPLHKDGSDNFAFLLTGGKRWHVFPVRDAPELDYRPLPMQHNTEYRISYRSDAHPTSEAFFQATQLRPLVIEQKAGQMLYLPAGWSHYVDSDAHSVMLNFWYEPRAFSQLVTRRLTPGSGK